MSGRPVSVADLHSSGPDPWYVEIVLRATGPGGIILPAGRSELLAVMSLEPEAVRRLGGPSQLRAAHEQLRRQFAQGAWRAGYRDGWAVECDVRRGRHRTLWTVPAGAPTEGARARITPGETPEGVA